MSPTRRDFLQTGAAAAAGLWLPNVSRRQPAAPRVADFQPTWASLAQYQHAGLVPRREVRHVGTLGPAVRPEHGDWYARKMYVHGQRQYVAHARALRASIDVGVQGHHPPVARRGVATGRARGALQGRRRAVLHGARQPPRQHRPVGLEAPTVERRAFGPEEGSHRRLGTRDAARRDEASACPCTRRTRGAGTRSRRARTRTARWPACRTTASSRARRGRDSGGTGLDPQDLYEQRHTPGRQLEWDWDASREAASRTARTASATSRARSDLIDRYEPDLLYFDDHRAAARPDERRRPADRRALLQPNMKRHGGRLEGGAHGQGAERGAAQMHGVGHRARRRHRHHAAAVADGHLHRRVALLAPGVRAPRLQVGADGGADAGGHREQERQSHAQHPAARLGHARRRRARVRGRLRPVDERERRARSTRAGRGRCSARVHRWRHRSRCARRGSTKDATSRTRARICDSCRRRESSTRSRSRGRRTACSRSSRSLSGHRMLRGRSTASQLLGASAPLEQTRTAAGLAIKLPERRAGRLRVHLRDLRARARRRMRS